METDVNSISTNLNNLQDDFDALETNLSTNYYTKTASDSRYYIKINLVSAVKYVLSQTNNVLSLYNLKDDFYDEGEIDLIVAGLET